MKAPERPTLLVLLVLAGLAGVTYAWSAGGAFLNWDDPTYVTHNPELHRGGFAGVAALFSSFHFANYNPLQRLSYLIEWQLFGDWSPAFRITNIVLHLVNAFLLYALLRVWCRQTWVAAGAAALFMIHPLGVETVAWIAERKSLMATGFAFGSVLCWLAAQDGMRHGRGIAWILFTLGMLAKTSIVVLPLLLIVLDWSRRESVRAHWKWYAAFLIPAIGLGLVQIAAASTAHSIQPLHGGNLIAHGATIVAVVPFYFLNLLLPFGLTPRHAFEPSGLGDPRFWLGVATLGVLAWGVVRSCRGERRFAFAIAWCLLALLVTLIVPIPIILADRYWYFAMPMLLAVFVDATSRLPMPKPRYARLTAGGLALGFAGALALATLNYARVWRDSTTLWTYALHQHPTDAEAWVSLGAARAEAGDLATARRAYAQAVTLEPEFAEAIENLADVEMQAGALDASQQRLGALLHREPERVKARAMFAVTFDLQGDTARADAEFGRARAAAPADAALMLNYVHFLDRHRRARHARRTLEGFLAEHPGNAAATRALRGLAAPPR